MRLSDGFCHAAVYGVPMNHESMTFNFSFFKVLAGLTINVNALPLITICTPS